MTYPCRRVQVEISPVRIGVPPFDKLHAWNLSSHVFSRVLVIDADAMMLTSVEELFAPPRALPALTMAHHGYDKAQVPSLSRDEASGASM